MTSLPLSLKGSISGKISCWSNVRVYERNIIVRPVKCNFLGGTFTWPLLVFQYIAKCHLRLTEIFYFKLFLEVEGKKFVGRTNIIGFLPYLVYSDCSGSFC